MEELNKTVSILTDVLESLTNRFSYELTHGDCDSVAVTVAQICKISHEITEASKVVTNEFDPAKMVEMAKSISEAFSAIHDGGSDPLGNAAADVAKMEK